jgi:hypothetical protein
MSLKQSNTWIYVDSLPNGNKKIPNNKHQIPNNFPMTKISNSKHMQLQGLMPSLTLASDRDPVC